MPTIQQATTFDFAAPVPMIAQTSVDRCRQAYEQNRHRIYAIAFWMTDNELAAEELMMQAFLSACRNCDAPSPDDIDRALLHELRAVMPLGKLTLNCAPGDARAFRAPQHPARGLGARRGQLPSTEKMIFLMHDVEQY